jgi:MoaA/NifB/PqqE/SkfB family radical SAM enzyme
VQDYEKLLDVVCQAVDLGVRSIVVIGGGEPTIHPRFHDLIGFIHARGVVPMVFTNALTMTESLARFLFENNASVMGKLDSLKAETQDYLCNRRGAFLRIRQGLENLLAAGYGSPTEPRRLRLGISFVSCRLNLDEIEDIWRFCRDGSIFPNMEVLTPTGRAKEHLSDSGLTLAEIQEYKLRLLEIDRAVYGYDWLPYTPLAASGCLQHLYSLYVTIDGDVRPCAPTKFDQHPALKRRGVYPHNVFRSSMKEVYDAPLFRYVRNIDGYLEGRCGGCEHLTECIGCRGYSYSVGINEGKTPLAALRSECLQCLK